jgi:DNA-binding response OmpR family regulator
VIILSARGDEADRVHGLADDYVTKPFSPRELIVRLRAVMRRAHADAAANKLRFGDITMDLCESRVMRPDASPIDLSPLSALRSDFPAPVHRR